ncbi:His Kinase A (phospho-acceptor) domain-containing protein [Verrucomicrobium sp. GAS474]|uniref:sensor histidine kinase n=1 Tax=Verrucomicrobium sp. GAS474 TaxID=1882831 RepID=UPI00087D3836|nr:ATP-binding protein [Verrucomicrobium sp. GAS474]SDU03217.1 His Kinase A (phospho-acceptor) domain-containing protein [Verrucomicrobium sp. GAS474]
MSFPGNPILIIDDNEENRYAFSRYLKGSGFQVWTAQTGEEGRALAQRRPSLIMLDIQLPDITGYELCRALKADPATASIPILHTSATFTESGDRTYGLEGGADGYLIQPIDSHELVATVRSLLRIRTAELAAKALAAQWQTTFDAISDGVCILDADDEVEKYNASFAALFSGLGALLRPGTSFDLLVGKLATEPPTLDWPARWPEEILIRNRWHRLTVNAVLDDEEERIGSVCVFSDIHSIREAEIKLQNANQDLEARVAERTASLREAIHQMEQFSYTVSHDLRAPLRAMQGYSSALLEDYAGELNEEARHHLEKIASNAARLDKMIIDVLTFTRISRESPILTEVSLLRTVQDVLEHYPGLKPPQAHVEVVVDAGHLVQANESGLVQALSNLLGNAAKFVAPGVTPRIRVHSERHGEMIRLSIDDNGIGIAPPYQVRLFGMFERVLPKAHYEGTGVGLAITRKVIERMGGKVGMESDGEHGSRFWIELAAGIENRKGEKNGGGA